MHLRRSALKLYFTVAYTKIAGKYRVDRSKISVSGMSSGGAMATHMHVAYSSIFMGVGMIAGSKLESFSISFTVKDLLLQQTRFAQSNYGSTDV